MNAVITGASMGIGYKLALKLANLGFDLYLTYCNNQEKILTLKEKIENETKVKCYINKLDLQDEKNIIEVSNDIKNVIVASTMLVLGLGGAVISIVTKDTNIQISGMSLAAIVGIILNLILPDIKTKKEK